MKNSHTRSYKRLGYTIYAKKTTLELCGNYDPQSFEKNKFYLSLSSACFSASARATDVSASFDSAASRSSSSCWSCFVKEATSSSALKNGLKILSMCAERLETLCDYYKLNLDAPLLTYRQAHIQNTSGFGKNLSIL